MTRIEFLTSKESIAAKFDEVRPFFERMTQTAMHGEFDVDDMLKMAMDGHALIGIVRNGNIATMGLAVEFINFPKYRAMNVVALAGTGLAAAMRDVWPLLTEFARQSGASYVQATCSASVARLMSRYGLEETYRVVRTPLYPPQSSHPTGHHE